MSEELHSVTGVAPYVFGAVFLVGGTIGAGLLCTQLTRALEDRMRRREEAELLLPRAVAREVHR